MLPMLRLILITLSCLICLAGCNLQPQTGTNSLPSSAGNLRVKADAASPAPTDRPTPMLTAPAPSTVTKSSDRDCDDRDAARPARQIDADVAIDYASKTVAVEQRIDFVNRDSVALDAIVLDVQANQWDGSMALESLQVDGVEVQYALEANQLHLPLPRSLLPGCALRLDLRYRLYPEPIRDGLRAYRGFLGYSPRQLNLAHFLPTPAARVDGDWRIHPPGGIGEQIVHEMADWRVLLTVTGAPAGLELAAPGRVTMIADAQWQVSLDKARDFAISLGDGFQAQQAKTESGVTVEVYAFPDRDNRTSAAASEALGEIVKALAVFERLFGEYPRERFVIVQGDFPDGMEFSGLAFVGSAWFADSDGTHKNYLTIVAVHELAHQWWYASVGSDSALHPWLDEALATYSEYLFFEAAYPADRAWWWSFRIAPFQPEGAVDSDVYRFSTMRQYINTIYLRGAQMLHNLRGDLGDEAFFDLLRAYLRSGRDSIMQPRDFWGLLDNEAATLTLETRQEFLEDPGVEALFADA